MAPVTPRRSPDHAHLIRVRRRSSSPAPTAVALVLHGGRSMSDAPVRAFQVAVLRLRPLARAVARAHPEFAVYRLQLAERGWNGTGASAIRDARWALAALRAAHPEVPIVLVGHSMGARTCFRVAGDPNIAGAVGLAPWLPADEPIRQLAGVPIRILHGTSDRVVPESSTRPWLARLTAAGLAVDRTLLTGTGHAMLHRWREWNSQTASAVARFAVSPETGGAARSASTAR
jgi:predicted esterase